MLLFFYEVINTLGGTSLSNPLACLTFCCCYCCFVVVVVEWGGGRLSLQPWEGCLDAPRVPPNRPSLGEGSGGGRCLWKVFSFGILGYVLLCQTSTSVYRENLTRFDDLLRLWLKRSPMMPFARVWTVNAQNRIKFVYLNTTLFLYVFEYFVGESKI